MEKNNADKNKSEINAGSKDDLDHLEAVNEHEVDRRPIDVGRYWAALWLIGAGVVVLLNNFGLLPWSFWFLVLHLWPFVLIAIGLDLVLRRYTWARIGLLVLFGVGVAVMIGWGVLNHQPLLYGNWRQHWPWLPELSMLDQSQGSSQNSYHSQVSSDEFSDVASRQITAKFDVGKFEMTDANEDYYVDFEAISESQTSAPTVETRLDDGRLMVGLEPQSEPRFLFHWGEPGVGYVISVGRPDLPTDVSLDLGAGSGQVAFTKLSVGALDLDVGAGKLDVELSLASLPTKDSTIDVGVGSVVLTLPEDVAVKAGYDVGLGTFRVDGENVEGDGQFESTNLDTADKVLHLTIKVGIGRVEIIHE